VSRRRTARVDVVSRSRAAGRAARRALSSEGAPCAELVIASSFSWLSPYARFRDGATLTFADRNGPEKLCPTGPWPVSLAGPKPGRTRGGRTAEPAYEGDGIRSRSRLGGEPPQ